VKNDSSTPASSGGTTSTREFALTLTERRLVARQTKMPWSIESMWDRSPLSLAQNQMDTAHRWARRLARREGADVRGYRMFVEGPLSPSDGRYRLRYRFRVLPYSYAENDA
jgi:hypothetical protein